MERWQEIAVGIFVGGLALFFTYEGIQRYRINAALQQLNAEMKQAAEQSRVQIQAAQLAAQQKQAAQIERQRAQAEAQRTYAADMQRSIEAGKIQRLNDAEAKAVAWKNYYKPTAACVADPVQTVCANAHIIAKRTFEAQYTR